MYEWIHGWVTTWLGRWISKINLALDFNIISDLHLLDYGFRLNNKVLLWCTLWEISEILLISIHMDNYCAFSILYKNLPLSLHWQTEGDHWSKFFQKLLEVKEAGFFKLQIIVCFMCLDQKHCIRPAEWLQISVFTWKMCWHGQPTLWIWGWSSSFK